MFCANCGQQASGNFCSHCGTRLNQPVLSLVKPPEDEVADILDVLPVEDWSHEVDYEKLVKIPEVKDMLALCASQARKGMTGEQFLEIYDKLFKPPISTKKMAEIGTPIYAQLGWETGKSRQGRVALPTGTVIVSVLCVLARNGQAIKQVHQLSDGCILHAVLPSNLFSLEGELMISLRRHGPATLVEATTRIPGQFYDWGKSERCLNGLFGEIGAAA
ncbi:MAG: hypothetical protein JNM56_38860 [Planctomycetia bacterium]|nr:hypothetical protein [Planctomycetia bacterium]